VPEVVVHRIGRGRGRADGDGHVGGDVAAVGPGTAQDDVLQVVQLRLLVSYAVPERRNLVPHRNCTKKRKSVRRLVLKD
jgi:hypothetical protein